MIVDCGCLSSTRRRDERRGERTGDRPGLLVDDEHPIGVAVEGETHVGARVQHPRHEVAEILGLDRVSGMVGERAIEFGERDLEMKRKARNTAGTTSPPMPLAVSATTLSGFSAPHIDEGANVVGERFEQVERSSRGRARCFDWFERPLVASSLMRMKTGLLTDRLRAGRGRA